MEIDGSYQPMEGESSTDESDSENAAYQSSCDQLLQISEYIFSDAAEEYAQLSAVIEKFEKWKKEYASSYSDAYMSLSVPAIFSPYVRLELLKRDPLNEISDFIQMKWHSLLFDYGLPGDDADANLIPELVEKLAISILHHQLADCWDMLSTPETEYAVSAINLVLGYVLPSSSAVTNLVAALRDRLADAVANLTVPHMEHSCIEGCTKRSKSCSIQEQRVVASLDGVWAGPSVTGDHSPKLQPLVNFLLSLGRTLEKKHVSGGIQTETENAKLAWRLKKMLVELNEYDQARAISRTFSLKKAL